MANKEDYQSRDITFPDQKIVEINLEHEMENAYIEYAMSVIVGRALPDVRDGLKPVHRRILYSMYESGLTSDKPFKKSATCVGDVLGKYHPHGDASVYDAMVRLAQDFSMRYPLVDGHGNFGSVDGDPPAAYRYTEARMSKMCNEMLRDIDKDTVDWDPNFDESLKEPRVLPSRFPNLLVNGSSGIAVGMTTNIPPHNLREVIDATICVLDNENATLDDLMEHIKGPDFPTRGVIMGRAGIRAAYATGKGHIKVRARTEMEEFGNGRTRIIVTELPYQVNKSRLVENIADQVKDKRLEGISGLRDESDGKKGMRIVIELKKDANPQVTLNRLFAQTQMQTTFGVILLALVNNQKQPKILTLRQILDEYIAFQEEVLTRRTQYDLKKAQERAHLLRGLLIAQDNIDEVIRIIRSSYDDAKEKLMERFGLDDVQAQAILDMRLKALQGLDREKLQAEFDELQARIAYYNQLLSDETMLRGVLKEELIQIRDKYGDERRTEIGFAEDDLDIEDLIVEEQCVFTMTANGYIKRTSASEYAAQGKGGMGKKGMATREEDYVNTVFTASTHDWILFFTDKGRVFRKKGYQIAEAGRTARGTNIVNVLQVDGDERVTEMIHTRDLTAQDRYLVMMTRNGTVKRIAMDALRNLRNNGLRVITLEEGDELITVRETDGTRNILIATHDGQAICFAETDVRVMGRTAVGVRGIRLKEGDYVVGAARATPGKAVLSITQNGYGKRTAVEEYRITNRGGLGIRNYMVTDKTGPVVGIKVVDGSEDIIVVTQSGTLIRTDVDGIRLAGRSTQGVIVMRFKEEGDQVIALALADKAPEEAADTDTSTDVENSVEVVEGQE
ncbi:MULTISPECIES: DNA gyrase subunit A [unclassified Pseudoflavonifractor]|uniref:DNA gyrase subunit A n=1 Tax=unclassified Pseudoflavonifractor TaxID=2628103 RepID=UPI000B36B306|nr:MULTISPECIES: DNA gyrase subunit A [unclassified Pseudoflavonifractor]OUN96523.1 DNA gyrase subunit A [Pseudoflavonifractor sp. An44]OUP41623.1 DNA gyrase subunit A [Pseudoflavonifractor sp. An187]